MKAHRMVDGLAEPFEDCHFAPRVDGGAEDDFLKEIGGEVLRAGKREERASGIEMLQGVKVEKFIAARRGVHVASLVREGWWVEHDQIEFSVDFLQIRKRV